MPSGEEIQGKNQKPILARTVLRDQIREYLINEILNGHYKEGERIVETRIAQQLGVSQGAVREALRELESLGFLETKPYSGTYVKEISIDDLIEIHIVRAALEALGAKLAASRFTDDELDSLEKLVDTMVKAGESQNAHKMIELNFDFHHRIIEKSGNSMLLRFYRMFKFSNWTTISTIRLGDELAYLAKRHYEVIDALRTHDPDQAHAAMQAHILELVSMMSSRKEDQAKQQS